MTPITVRFKGEMGRLFGETWKLAVKTAAEAVRAVECQRHGVFAYLNAAHEQGNAFQVLVGDRPISPEGLLDPVSAREEIVFVPVLQGAKEQGLLNVVLGVVIIAAATYFSAGSLTGAAISATFEGGGLAGFSASFGLAMALGGVATMLAGKPKTQSLEEAPGQQPSYLFNGPTNRVQQGNVYPVVYGTMIVGSQIISAGISNEDYVSPDAGEGGGGDGSFDPDAGDFGGYESN